MRCEQSQWNGFVHTLTFQILSIDDGSVIMSWDRNHDARKDSKAGTLNETLT